jgi:hypothetical protein
LDELDVDSEPGGGGWVSSSSQKYVSNSIECLILQEKIDLMNEYFDGWKSTGLTDADFTTIINELTQQLKELQK